MALALLTNSVLDIGFGIAYWTINKTCSGIYNLGCYFFSNNDESDKTTEKEESIILALSIQDIFYNNVLGAQTNLILNYDWKLRSFSKYAQQIEMESNGKRVDLNGNKIEHQSNAIVWGGYGPESQHSFFQQIYQGTKNYNIYIIASIKDKNKLYISII